MGKGAGAGDGSGSGEGSGKGTGYFTNYPKQVFLILTNEFCERFSYYGMKAILVLYLTRALGFDDNTATSIYHAFSAVCYFTPILGAIIADGWLGKFKTILYVSMIYGLGNIVMTVTAIPINGEFIVWTPFIGLTLIAFGTGGIKPCVSAFGGDQFSKDQQRQKDSFFSLFYMSINIGSLLATIVTPLIRSNVVCFDQPCYAMAFGIPAALMIISIGVFAIGSKWYVKIPPGESTLTKLCGCVWVACKRKFSCKKKTEEEKKEHWLDYADPDYDSKFIQDTKDVMTVLWLFLPLPVFWALFDQQGSRWTLQASIMDGDFGDFVMQPDMLQVMNPLLVIIIVPILESLIYPCCDKLHIPNRPLQRMSLGMILAGTAFLMAGFLQIAIDNDAPPDVASGQMKVKFINTAQYGVNITGFSEGVPDLVSLDPLMDNPYEYHYTKAGMYNYSIEWRNTTTGESVHNGTYYIDAQERTAYQIFTNDPFTTTTEIQHKTDPTPKGVSTTRIYNGHDTMITVYLKSDKEDHPKEFLNISAYSVSEYHDTMFADYHATLYEGTSNVSIQVSGTLISKNAAAFTCVITRDVKTGEFTMTVVTDVAPPSVNIFLQIPQYVVMSLGECLFSVTGLSFAYSQSPISMKSILQAAWLLTVAIGNVVVIIIAETGSSMGQMAEFFLYAILMYVTTVVFAIMGFFYKYVTPRKLSVSSHSSSSSSSSSRSSEEGVDNKGVELDDAEKDNHSEKEKLGTDGNNYQSLKETEALGPDYAVLSGKDGSGATTSNHVDAAEKASARSRSSSSSSSTSDGDNTSF